MKARLFACLAVTLLALLGAAPAQAAPAGTPAERAREIATALTKDPLYVDPAYKTALPANLRADLSQKASALPYPAYTIILPLTPSDEFQGQESNVLTLVMDALRKPGLYVVVDGGSRFPWYDTKDVPQLSEEKLDASRERALDDEGYDAGPTEVVARMYELLAQPGIPGVSPRPTSSGTPERAAEPGGHGWIVAGSIVGGLVVLIGLGLLIGRRRGGSAPRREKTFQIPPHVAATVAAERRRKLTRDTTAELTRLGSQLAALPTTAGAGLVHQQAALDDHAAASKILDSPSPELVDLVGAMVLLDKGRREYDAAVAIAAGRRADAVPDLCAFNPLHGRATGRPTKVESDGTTLTLPLCTECRQALKRGAAPASLPGKNGPYWYENTLWARTFYGTTDEDLASAVSRGDLHH
ncbi:hypothetical protein GCM10009630_59940 [Kribbella jejuensis]|uniref:Uncharacterized protein n=1 Tax=Kribbella jejuensis TaxID=236068 RepID=A0A542EU49_9ACTN|nr:hypothetical protein [Kribbella jejuensis]TQJ18706.1 hypothetical protein FB475_2855 [Kribbella jejuensis]